MKIQNQFFSSISHHHLSLKHSLQTTYIWVKSDVATFDELLISWNACRPLKGHYVILSSLYIRNRWSSWLLFAVWGEKNQYSFHEISSQSPIRSFQDQIELLEQEVATGFRIRIEACQGASLDKFYSLHACTSSLRSNNLSLEFFCPFGLRQSLGDEEITSRSILKKYEPACNFSSAGAFTVAERAKKLQTQVNKSFFTPKKISVSYSLPIDGLSQIQLNHPRSMSMCSPTSTTAALRYLLKNATFRTTSFLKQCVRFRV